MNVTYANQLVMENIKLVYYIVNRFQYTRMEQEEMVSIGQIGLIKASRTYEREEGIKFGTYAARCIHNELVTTLRKKRAVTLSLDTPLRNESEKSTLGDVILSDENVDEEIEKSFVIQQLREAIGTLPVREQFIIKSYYGIDCAPMKQHEIGAYVGLSQSYVARIIRGIQNKLRQLMQSVS